MSDTILDTGDISENKTAKTTSPHGASTLVDREKQKINK